MRNTCENAKVLPEELVVVDIFGSPTLKFHAAGRGSTDTSDSTTLNEVYNNSEHYYDHGDELLSENPILREAKARYQQRMAKLHSHLAKENQIQNLVREVYRYEAKSMLLEERLKQEQLLVKVSAK